VERCWKSTKLAVALHWSLLVDCEEAELLPCVCRMQSQLYRNLQLHNTRGHEAVNGQVRFKAFLDMFAKEVCVPWACRCSGDVHGCICVLPIFAKLSRLVHSEHFGLALRLALCCTRHYITSAHYLLAQTRYLGSGSDGKGAVECYADGCFAKCHQSQGGFHSE
jgi:hypothetical protein